MNGSVDFFFFMEGYCHEATRAVREVSVLNWIVLPSESPLTCVQIS